MRTDKVACLVLYEAALYGRERRSVRHPAALPSLSQKPLISAELSDPLVCQRWLKDSKRVKPQLGTDNAVDERDIVAAAHDAAKINASQRANVTLARRVGVLCALCVERKQPPLQDAPAAHIFNPKPLFLFPLEHPKPYSCLLSQSFDDSERHSSPNGTRAQFVVKDLKREQNQGRAAADFDGLKKLLKEQRFLHLLFNATLAICSVLESLPVQAAPGRWAAL
ncbi:hypothetical protein Q8A73_019315 [Channa argus]|nr:hypothetical protein Q8A73_019315 [Channa argus]